jgi:hypothetical protein
VAQQKFFGIAAALPNLRRALWRPEHAQLQRYCLIHQASVQRVAAGGHNNIDLLGKAMMRYLGGLLWLQFDGGHKLRSATVARRTEHRLSLGAVKQLPDKGVSAPILTKDQHFHEL